MPARLFAVAFYVVLGILILTFIFSNRASVTITLLPFLQTVTAPLYMGLAATFAAGLLLGLLYSFYVTLSYGRKLRRSQRALEMAEKELATRSLSTLIP